MIVSKDESYIHCILLHTLYITTLKLYSPVQLADVYIYNFTNSEMNYTLNPLITSIKFISLFVNLNKSADQCRLYSFNVHGSQKLSNNTLLYVK